MKRATVYLVTPTPYGVGGETIPSEWCHQEDLEYSDAGVTLAWDHATTFVPWGNVARIDVQVCACQDCVARDVRRLGRVPR